MNPTITFIFYTGVGFVGELVRDLSVCPGERVADTPGHIAILIGNCLYQATWPRVQRISPSAMHEQEIARINLQITGFQAHSAIAWLNAQVGKRYSRMAIIKDFCARLWPGTVSRWSREFMMSQSSWTCSTLAYTAARVAGIKLREPDYPIDPNSLLRMLSDYVAATTPRFADQRPPVRDAQGKFVPGNPYTRRPRGANGKFVRGRIGD